MSAKPSSLPIWATDVGAEVTEPNLAKKQQGHVGGEPIFGDYENWYKRLVYLWTEYLRDGAFEGSHSITGNLAIGGGFAHGDRVVTVNAYAGPATSGTFTSGGFWQASSGTDFHAIPLPMGPGDRIKSIDFVWLAATGVNGQRELRLDVLNIVPGGTTTLLAAQTSNQNVTGDSLTRVTTFDINTDRLISTNEVMFARLEAAGSGDRFYAARVTYDRPSP